MSFWLRPLAAALAVVFGVAGTTLIAMGLIAAPEIPPPASAAAPTAAAPATPAAPAAAAATTAAAKPTGVVAPAIPRSVPVRLSIPAVGIRTDVVALGLRADGTLQVPPPRGDSPAGWYKYSPTPGETGSSVIVGHVDSTRDGPAVFYPLRRVSAGDRIVVTRADGSTVTFAVARVELYPKDDFPSKQVYGPSDEPALTLITCGGSFDRTRHSYRSNLIVFSRAVPDPA